MKYQKDYADSRPQMYDRASRKIRAERIVKTLADYYGNKNKLKGLKVLDVGASTGIMDFYLAPHFKELIGVDIDKKAIKFARENFKRKNLRFKVDDAMQLSFKENSFDIVICAQVYEHVPDAEKLMDEIYRVLKPEGICYFAALNRLWPIEPHYNLPFLSWLPKSWANYYMKILGKGDTYYETTRSYWGLKKLTKKFQLKEYTEKILKDPKKYGYKEKIGGLSFFTSIIAPIAKYFTPTFFWILVKKKDTT